MTWLHSLWQRWFAQPDPDDADSGFLRTTGSFMPETPPQVQVPGETTRKLMIDQFRPTHWDDITKERNEKARARWLHKD